MCRHACCAVCKFFKSWPVSERYSYDSIHLAWWHIWESGVDLVAIQNWSCTIVVFEWMIWQLPYCASSCIALFIPVASLGRRWTLLSRLPGEIKLLNPWTLTHEPVIIVSIHMTWYCFMSVCADRWASVIDEKAATALVRIMGLI